MIFESLATQLLVMISKSTGTVCADESSLQLWRQSGWWFVSRQLLDFQWWFQSQVGMCAPMNPHVRCRRSFIDDFWFSNDSVFGDDFVSQHGMWALTNPGVSYAGSLVDYFWVVSYSVFDDDFRVNMDCVRRQIQASTREAVSVMISKSVATQFWWRFQSQLVLCGPTNPRVICGSSFIGDFWVGND